MRNGRHFHINVLRLTHIICLFTSALVHRRLRYHDMAGQRTLSSCIMQTEYFTTCMADLFSCGPYESFTVCRQFHVHVCFLSEQLEQGLFLQELNNSSHRDIIKLLGFLEKSVI